MRDLARIVYQRCAVGVISPDRNSGYDLEKFQDVFHAAEDLANDGLIKVLEVHRSA